MNLNKNKEIVYKKLYEMKNHPTAQEILLELKKDHPRIGIATVYRNLNTLLEEKRIIRIESTNFKDRFDATISNHNHARCVKCNRLEDVNIDFNFKIKENIELVKIDVSIKHICSECSKR